MGFQPSEPARYLCGVYVPAEDEASWGRLLLVTAPVPVLRYSVKRPVVQEKPDMSVHASSRMWAPMVDSRKSTWPRALVSPLGCQGRPRYTDLAGALEVRLHL